MGRKRVSNIKWERATLSKPSHNIISSDFPRYVPQPWKYMEGEPLMSYILSYEYQRLWLEEREAWKKRMYPENITENVDVVKRYVLNFKTTHQQPKHEKKKIFRLKKFENIPARESNRRSPDDKVVQYYEKKKKEQEEKEKEAKSKPQKEKDKA